MTTLATFQPLVPPCNDSTYNSSVYIGMSRQHCQQLIQQQQLPSIDFAHWLALPTLGMLLVFQHQQCVCTSRF